MIFKQSDEMPKLALSARFDAGCKSCGDALQTVKASAPDHGTMRPMLIAWCMDCRDIRGFALLKAGEA